MSAALDEKARKARLKLSPEDIALTVARAADEKHAQDILVLDLRDISLMTDYFVIADAPTEVQARAIANGVQERLRERGVEAMRREGWEDARWVLLDYGDAVVHIFQTEDRRYYDIERLWGDAPRMRVSSEEQGAALDALRFDE